MNGLHDSPYEPADLTVPVLCEPMGTDRLVSALRKAAEEKFPFADTDTASRKAQRRQHLQAVGMFEDFLSGRGAFELDEDLLDDFAGHLTASGLGRGRACSRKFQSCIRVLVNALPGDLRRRELLTPARLASAKSFARLTPGTRNALRRFLREGRRLRGERHPLVSAELLTPKTRRDSFIKVLTIRPQ